MIYVNYFRFYALFLKQTLFNMLINVYLCNICMYNLFYLN